MLDVLRQDFIRTARAKGFKENRVVYKHGLRNGLLPVVTIFGLMIPSFIGGAVVTNRSSAGLDSGSCLLIPRFKETIP
jgi:peptide/nickel transport system permease protein